MAQKVKIEAGRRKNSILVWGMNPEIYFMADHPPASRFITAGFLSGFAGGGDQTEVGPSDLSSKGTLVGMASDFLADPAKGRRSPVVPVVIVDDSYGKPYAPKNIPVIDSLFANDQCDDRVGIPKGAFTSICTLRPDGAAGVLSWARSMVDDAARSEFLHPEKDNP